MPESSSPQSYIPAGLSVVLDKLGYQYEEESGDPHRKHLFIYYLTIHNQSDQTLTLLARKWVITHHDGSTEVIEGDKIVGETPTLKPGQHFSYNSFMLTGGKAEANGAFFGMNNDGEKIHVRIPSFYLNPPQPE